MWNLDYENKVFSLSNDTLKNSVLVWFIHIYDNSTEKTVYNIVTWYWGSHAYAK